MIIYEIKNKKYFYIFFICFLTIYYPTKASGDILFGKDYHETLHKYLTSANNSILVAMYFIIIDNKDTKNPVNSLVDDLINASNRGVEVKVILEDSKLKENRYAYEKLRKNNVAVYFDMPDRLLHIKGISIDNKYLFIGSTNWSRAAIEDNYETACFYESIDDASKFKSYIDTISIQKTDLLFQKTEGIELPSEFILSPDKGSTLLKARAFKQFDLYLLLQKIYHDKENALFDIDYDSLARQLGYNAPADLGRYRNWHHYFYERIHRSLKRLKNYGFIDYRKGKVALRPYDELETHGHPFIMIPAVYWNKEYCDTLSMRAKYMYLICLYEASRSTRYPFWFRSQEDMSHLYGISDTTISLGLLELEEKGIIEITREKPMPPDFSDRKANIYRMSPL